MASNRGRYAFFDLEGPLSPQDNCVDLFHHYWGEADWLFDLLDRYDDLLALSGREPYEAGGTLALATPFLASAGMTTSDLRAVSEAQSTLQPGAIQLVDWLRSEAIVTSVISTSFEPHATNVTSQVGVPAARVYATKIDDDALQRIAPPSARSRILESVDSLQGLVGTTDDTLTAGLDMFFGGTLAELGGADPFKYVQVRGGRRKSYAAESVLNLTGSKVADAVFVGDSITDAEIMKYIDAGGGLAIAFNGDLAALRQATVAVAGSNLSAVRDVIAIWLQGGRSAVFESVTGENSMPAVTWLAELRGSAEALTELGAAHRGCKTHLRALGVAEAQARNSNA